MLESDGTKEQPKEEDLVAASPDEASPDEASPEEDSAAEDGNGSVDGQETSVDGQETGETPEQDAEEALFLDLPDEEFVEETSEASVEPAETDVEAGPLSEEDELFFDKLP